MALQFQLHRLLSNGYLQGRSFSNLSISSIMPQHSVLQNLQGSCIQYSPFGNAGRYRKCIQLKSRKSGYNCRLAINQLAVSRLKLEQENELFRSLPHAKLRVGTTNTSKPNNNFTFGCFEADNTVKCNLSPSELITRRYFSVKASQKVQVPKSLMKRSEDMTVRGGRNSNSALKALHGSQEQVKSSAARCGLDGGVQHPVSNSSSVVKGASKRTQPLSEVGDTGKLEREVSRNSKHSDENLGKSTKKNVKSGTSIPTKKRSATAQNDQARLKPDGQPSNKSDNLLSVSTSTSSASNSQGLNIASRGNKPNAASVGQTIPTMDKEINPVENMPLPVVDNHAVTHQQLKKTPGRSVKKSSQKKVAVVKSEKMPTEKNKAGGQVLSTAETSQASNSKATSRRTSRRGQQTPVEVKIQKRKLLPLYPPNGKSVVVVESVTKAKIIQKYLGDMYEVLPSYGHVRDLAGRSGSVRPDDDFSMVWEVPASAWTHLKSIKVALNGAKNLVLASDPDREGEAIAWHITEMLQQQDALHQGITVARVAFHEITESSIKHALQAPRDINANLVHAYLARRALDYLIGFNISPLLWRKLPGCQSAGRVQSAALALVCDREMEIEEFKAQEYWTVEVEFHQLEKKGVSFQSYLTHLESKRLEKLSIRSQAEAKAIEGKITSLKFLVADTKKGKMQRNRPMPYITSTLQQDAANRLQFTATYTMMLAQKLYEGVKLSEDEATGLITYMRTDGLHVSDEAAKDIRSLIMERYGHDFASKNTPRHVKVKNAQEAHEAIRPTNIRRLPSMLAGVLDKDSLKLYTLIWSRTMACQMEPATVDKIQVDVADSGKSMIFRSTGSKVGFLGYQAVYKDLEAVAIGNDESEGSACNEAFNVLSTLKSGDRVTFEELELKQHHTEPPSHYSEATLVKKLEELGIGRPSTYASVMKVLQERNYVVVKSRVLFPEFRGRMVSAFLSDHFSEVTDYSFTADMENELDNVSAGTTEWKGLLKDYWARFSMYCKDAGKVEIRQVEKMLEERYGKFLFASLPNKNRICPSCSQGTLVFKVSRFGAGYFIGCDQHPKCKYIAKTMYSEDDDVVDPQKPESSFQPKLLGVNPGSNEKIYLKNGPYGFYIQLGDDRKGYSPKRASISQHIKDVESISLEDALDLLRYPVTLGKHPEDQQPVVLKVSKFGFSIKHRRTIAPVPKNLNPEDVTLEKALKLLLSKDAKRCGRPKGKPRVEEAMEAMFSQ
ncbi:hypothetical protein AAC387_Pa03g2948 [Persea americana]